ncbi:unnamed protein product [Paramecium sonneborni]|uniref:Uncharacterized protein n=1 Tax=Paramecium sonneborni TaxID=65129 RepID=A0A8S1QG00_9CILI|nr:unnamed protein product [Paramecium sonneborni]
MAQEIFNKKWLQTLGYYSLRLYPFKFVLNYQNVMNHYQKYQKQGDYLIEFLNIPYRLSNQGLLGQVLTQELQQYRQQSLQMKIKKIRAISVILYYSGSGDYRAPKILQKALQYDFIEDYFEEFYGEKNKIILQFLFRTILTLGLSCKLLERVDQKMDQNLLLFILNEFQLRQLNDFNIRLTKKEIDMLLVIKEKWKDNKKINWALYQLNIDQDLM